VTAFVAWAGVAGVFAVGACVATVAALVFALGLVVEPFVAAEVDAVALGVEVPAAADVVALPGSAIGELSVEVN
jgi:hypothetical protein